MVHLLVQDAAGHLVWLLYSGSQFQEVKQAKFVESGVGYRNRKSSITGNDLPEALISTDLTANGFGHVDCPALPVGGELFSKDVAHSVAALFVVFTADLTK